MVFCNGEVAGIGGEKEPQSRLAWYAGRLGSEDGFRALSWNTVAYSDLYSDSDTVMTSRDAK